MAHGAVRGTLQVVLCCYARAQAAVLLQYHKLSCDCIVGCRSKSGATALIRWATGLN